MILTGKCKEKFFEYIYYSEDTTQVNETNPREIQDEADSWLGNQDERFRNALIIDFFDSIGIYINTILDETNKHKFKYLVTDINIRHLHCWTQGTNKESRKEATIQAIKKANDLYNNTYKV